MPLKRSLQAAPCCSVAWPVVEPATSRNSCRGLLLFWECIGLCYWSHRNLMMSSPEREKKVGQAFKQGLQRKGFAWEKSRLAIYRDNKTVNGQNQQYPGCLLRLIQLDCSKMRRMVDTFEASGINKHTESAARPAMKISLIQCKWSQSLRLPLPIHFCQGSPSQQGKKNNASSFRNAYK